MKQCVIFDMDGVIIDSEPIHQKCERQIFNLLRMNVSGEEHNALLGATDETMWSRLGEIYTLPITVSEAIQLKKRIYLEYLKREASIKPVPFVTELITNLHKNNFLLALASSSPHEQINYILENIGIRRYFHTIVSGEDVKEGKPHPGVFLKAAEAVGITPESCVVIEDSYNGVTAAKNANMKCIGYKNINSGYQDLSQADIIINSLEEITMVVLKKILLSS